MSTAQLSRGWIDKAPDNYRVVELANGDKIFIENSVHITNCTVGRFSYINSGSVFGGNDSISIGSFTSISYNVYCWAGDNHETRSVTSYPLKNVLGMELSYAELRQNEQVTIGSDVWIGQGSRILGGVTIGDGCVIGTRAVVTRDCEPFGVYVGVPAKLIKKRFPDCIIQQLQELRWWDWPIAKIYRNTAFFNADLRTFEGDIRSLVVDELPPEREPSPTAGVNFRRKQPAPGQAPCAVTF